MKNVKYNNGEYFVAVQGIERTKNGTFQEICIYPKREYILYDWYWSMAYACALDNTDEKYTFLEFANTVFKAGEPKIYCKASQMF